MPGKMLVVAGAAMLAMSSSVSAVSMSMNWIDVSAYGTVDACVAAGEATFQRSGLSLLQRTATAAWAENSTQDQLYVVYCVMDRGVAVITGSGDNLDAVDAMVTRVVNSFGQGGPTGKPSR